MQASINILCQRACSSSSTLAAFIAKLKKRQNTEKVCWWLNNKGFKIVFFRINQASICSCVVFKVFLLLLFLRKKFNQPSVVSFLRAGAKLNEARDIRAAGMWLGFRIRAGLLLTTEPLQSTSNLFFSFVWFVAPENSESLLMKETSWQTSLMQQFGSNAICHSITQT